MFPPWVEAILRYLDRAVVVIDANDHMVYENEAAKNGLCVVDDDVHANRLIDIARSVREGDGELRELLIAEHDGLRCLGDFWRIEADAVVVVLSPAPLRPTPAARLSAALALESADARLAVAVKSGLSNGEIADLWNLPVGTIKTRVSRLYKKLRVKKRAELIALCFDVLGQTNEHPDDQGN